MGPTLLDIETRKELPDRLPTNICFGGSDLKTAHVTLCEKGTLGRLAWPVPGLPLNFLNR